MGSKVQNHAPARGPPKSAEGRSRGKGKGECFAPFISKTSIFASKCCFFGLGMLLSWSGVISQKMSNFEFFIKIFTFCRHISWPEQVFPSSNWVPIEPDQSSKIVFKPRLRISWSVKYIYQKYGVKGSKSCTSAGRPKTSRRPAERWRWRRVLRTM